MSRIADFRRWVARNPGTVDRALIAAGFVLGVFAVVNGARNDDLALNLLLALLGGVAVAALIAWSRRLFAATDYLAAAAILAIVGVVGLRVAARLFGRETILTRWS